MNDGNSTALARPLAERVDAYARVLRAKNTVRAYRSDWKDFCAFASEQNQPNLPPDPKLVAAYLLYLKDEGLGWFTLQRRLTAINAAHKLWFDSLEPPPKEGIELVTENRGLREVCRNLRREMGTAQKQKAPIMAEILKKMVDATPATIVGARDKALFLTQFTGALRSDELLSLDARDLIFTENGAKLIIRRSKTDQEGRGREIAMPLAKQKTYCATRSLARYLKLDPQKDPEGPLFRRLEVKDGVLVGTKRLIYGRYRAEVLRPALERIGVKPNGYGTHSFRAGFCTEAGDADVPLQRIMQKTGHVKVETVLKYIRRGRLFEDDAGKGLL